MINSSELKTFDKIIIVGDFNYPTILWDGSWSGPRNNTFIECLRDAYLCQAVNKPTRRREGQKANILDLVLVILYNVNEKKLT